MKIFRWIWTVCLLGLVMGAPVWSQTAEMDAGMSAFYQEKWDEAIPQFEAALKADPQNSMAIAYLLHSYYKKKDFTAVINQFEGRASAKGNDAVAQAQLGMAYFLKGLVMPQALEEALSEFKNAVKDDNRCSLAYTGMGMTYFQKRMMPRAKGYFVRALRINPNDAMALDRLGNIMMVDEKKPAEALDLYLRLTQLLPNYPDGHYFTGSALFDLKRYEEAIPYLAKARDLDPKGLTQGFDAATLLGDCFMKLNRGTEAVAAFEQAQKMDPKSEYVQIKLKKARDGATSVTPNT